MNAPFQPNDIVEGIGKMRGTFRVKRCIRPSNAAGWRVLLRHVHCRDPHGFAASSFRKAAGTGRNGFDFRHMLGAKA